MGPCAGAGVSAGAGADAGSGAGPGPGAGAGADAGACAGAGTGAGAGAGAGAGIGTGTGAGTVSFGAFIAKPQCQCLRNALLYDKYYSRKLLDSFESAVSFVLPDKRSLPSKPSDEL